MVVPSVKPGWKTLKQQPLTQNFPPDGKVLVKSYETMARQIVMVFWHLYPLHHDFNGLHVACKYSFAAFHDLCPTKPFNK
jgi:hypothetical protein